MGFWHTGYMEHHEDAFFGVFRRAYVPPRPPVFTCEQCSAEFDDPADRDAHRFEGHPLPKPRMAFQGRECGTSPLVITRPFPPEDLAIGLCDEALLNGAPIDPLHLPQRLAEHRHGTAMVRLRFQDVESSFTLRFAIADEDDLEGVDRCVLDLARSRRLDVRAIEQFIQQASPFASADLYCDGLATYFYGVLARERSPDSDLAYDQYRERFDGAAAKLRAYNRVPARVICALISFHFNHLADAVERGAGTRVAEAALRLWHLLEDGSVAEVGQLRGQEGDYDGLFSDAETERVLTWTGISLDGSATEGVEALESYLQRAEPFDRLKLRVIAATHYLALGDVAAARRHANDLANSPVAGAWAQRILKRLPTGGVAT